MLVTKTLHIPVDWKRTCTRKLTGEGGFFARTWHKVKTDSTCNMKNLKTVLVLYFIAVQSFPPCFCTLKTMATRRSSPLRVQSCIGYWCQEKEIWNIFSLFSFIIPKGYEEILSCLFLASIIVIANFPSLRVHYQLSMFFIKANPAKIAKTLT